eukprot:498666-Rhodomonas_salina.4
MRSTVIWIDLETRDIIGFNPDLPARLLGDEGSKLQIEDRWRACRGGERHHVAEQSSRGQEESGNEPSPCWKRPTPSHPPCQTSVNTLQLLSPHFTTKDALF